MTLPTDGQDGARASTILTVMPCVQCRVATRAAARVSLHGT